MSVALRKLEGVESAKASLNEGVARITLKPGNKVRLEQIRKTVNEQGFTPKDARVTGVGDLVATGGRLQFRLAGSGEVFPVMETQHADWAKHAGKNVVVTGIVAAPPTDKEPGTIQITEVKKRE